jgi:hypothetical protein
MRLLGMWVKLGLGDWVATPDLSRSLPVPVWTRVREYPPPLKRPPRDGSVMGEE